MRRMLLFAALFVAIVCMGLVGVGSQAVHAQEGEAPDVEIPFLLDWMGSGHADAEAEAFRH